MVHRDLIHVWPFQVDQEELTGKTEEDNPFIESIGPILIDDAMDMMRSAVRGNGLDEKAVFFNAFYGTVLHFETYQVFKITATTGEKYLPGKQHGIVVGSRQDARNKVMATVENAATNIDVHKTTIKFLKLRNDLGFAAEGWAIRYDGMKRNFVVHEKCTTCSGLGKNNCNDCKGTRKRNCARCTGSKLMTCTNCKGRKQFPVKGGAAKGHDKDHAQAHAKGGKPLYKKCKMCTGTGKIRCAQCKGTGSAPCKTCQGSGKVGCKPCTNTGWRSHITFMEVSAKCWFDYDKSKLPPEVPPLIDHLRARMVLEKHAHIRINEDLERKQELDNRNKPKEYMMRRPEEFAITYDVRLPWGDIGFNWEPRSEPVTGKLFGFQPALVHMQPFLEEIALPGIRALGEASATEKHIAAKLHEATRFRIIGDTLLAATLYGPARAIETIFRRYPFGIREETLKNLVDQSHQSLKFLTQTARVMGLVSGLALTAAMDGAYYLGPVRAQVIAHVDDKIAQGAIDLAPVLIGGIAATVCIKLFSRRALRDVVGRLLPAKKKGKTEKLKNRAGLAAYLGYLGSAAIYAFVLAAAVLHFGMAPPDWLEQARTALKL
jgi:hypothetical protein